MASGSLAQYISISYSKRLPNTSTVDDVEGTLSKFVPGGPCHSILLLPLVYRLLSSSKGYFVDLDEFNARVEKDAIEFKPFGQKIGSYKRSSSGKGKGKAPLTDADLNDDDEDVVTFEIYHVSLLHSGLRPFSDNLCRRLGIHRASESIIARCKS